MVLRIVKDIFELWAVVMFLGVAVVAVFAGYARVIGPLVVVGTGKDRREESGEIG